VCGRNGNITGGKKLQARAIANASQEGKRAFIWMNGLRACPKD
jgi:hypothetical protein